MEHSTILPIAPSDAAAVPDLLAAVVLGLMIFCAIRFWRAALQAAVLIAIVSLPFTPVWDGFWTLVTKDWLRKHSGVTTVVRGERRPVAHLIFDSDPDPSMSKQLIVK